MALSAAFFAAGVFFTVKSRGRSFFLAFFSCASLVYLLVTIAYVVADSFTADGINEAVLYHVKYGLGGAGFSGYRAMILSSIVFGVLGVLAVAWVYRKTASSGKSRAGYIGMSVLFLLTAFYAHPATGDILRLISSAPESGDFRSYYRAPYAVERGEDRRNVVFIYGEGLEGTYLDQGIFPGLMPGLRDLQEKSTYFTKITDVYGTGWTIGGMVASQCGIPLFTPSHGNSMAGMDAFLPNAVCLGDLLGRKGYQLSYYGGADLKFAGKGKFYASHGFGEVKGKRELRPTLPETYATGPWGIYDDTLLDIAFERFTELSEADKPFGLFLLTLDTHPPRGDASGSCEGIQYQDGSNAILNTVACSDYLLSAFIKRILQSPHGRNTVVVVVSDHLMMSNTANERLNNAQRANLFMIVDPLMENPEKVERPGTVLDIGPTVLPFLGFEGSLGLGRDLLGSEEPLIAQLKRFTRSLGSWREDIQAFWAFPTIRGETSIDVKKREIEIEGRVFKFPILVELNEDLETTLKFQFYSDESHKRLSDHVRQMNEGTPFLWIDRCRVMTRFDSRLSGDGYCLVTAVSGGAPTKSARIEGPLHIKARELRALVSSVGVSGAALQPEKGKKRL